MKSREKGLTMHSRPQKTDFLGLRWYSRIKKVVEIQVSIQEVVIKCICRRAQLLIVQVHKVDFFLLIYINKDEPYFPSVQY